MDIRSGIAIARIAVPAAAKPAWVAAAAAVRPKRIAAAATGVSVPRGVPV